MILVKVYTKVSIVFLVYFVCWKLVVECVCVLCVVCVCVCVQVCIFVWSMSLHTLHSLYTLCCSAPTSTGSCTAAGWRRCSHCGNYFRYPQLQGQYIYGSICFFFFLKKNVLVSIRIYMHACKVNRSKCITRAEQIKGGWIWWIHCGSTCALVSPISTRLPCLHWTFSSRRSPSISLVFQSSFRVRKTSSE